MVTIATALFQASPPHWGHAASCTARRCDGSLRAVAYGEHQHRPAPITTIEGVMAETYVLDTCCTISDPDRIRVDSAALRLRSYASSLVASAAKFGRIP